MIKLEDTITAIATPPGEGGVGIVRVSGRNAFPIADRLYRAKGGASLSERPSHTIHYGTVVDRKTGETVDDALALLFRAPYSYTGEDVVELSCHGGPVTLARVLRLVLDEGARHAEPGEFTQRAFLNGRMDLSQAEAVCDLIRARTETQQRLALRQTEGALSRKVHALKDQVVGALAAVEVTIDFSDEVGDLDYTRLHITLQGIEDRLDELILNGERGRIYREGVRLAIVGQPNVGKSSLMNALLREDRAIVTPIAGTTRDTIEETANIRGIPITAIDTAGLRETEDPVERIGVDRARAAIESSGIVLMLVDAQHGWSVEDRRILDEVGDRPVIGVINKIDLIASAGRPAVMDKIAQEAGGAWTGVSAETLQGIDKLELQIANRVAGGDIEEDSVVLTNARHLHALEQARESIAMARKTASDGLPPDFISIDLRGALDSLGRITGETATEEIIHRIFHDFCVGK